MPSLADPPFFTQPTTSNPCTKRCRGSHMSAGENTRPMLGSATCDNRTEESSISGAGQSEGFGILESPNTFLSLDYLLVVLFCAMLCCAILCGIAVLCCAVLCYIVLCCAGLCCIVQPCDGLGSQFGESGCVYVPHVSNNPVKATQDFPGIGIRPPCAVQRNCNCGPNVPATMP